MTFSLPSPSSMLKRQQKREFTVLQTSSPLFHVIHFIKFLANFSGRDFINPKDCFKVQVKKEKIGVIVYFVVVQRRQRNLLNSVVYVQSCCVANLNLFATCTSPIMHLICPSKFCISIVFNFSWDGCNTQEK